jgi:hypothetical protein
MQMIRKDVSLGMLVHRKASFSSTYNPRGSVSNTSRASGSLRPSVVGSGRASARFGTESEGDSDDDFEADQDEEDDILAAMKAIEDKSSKDADSGLRRPVPGTQAKESHSRLKKFLRAKKL